MEKKINRKIEEWTQTFKHNIKDVILNTDNKQEIVDFIYNYPGLQLDKFDFTKRKRVKNIVPLCDKCCALRANGEQCSRRKRDGSEYCGTHIKGIPHGRISAKPPKKTHKTVQVWIQEIHGISYYIDKFNNVYDHHDIVNNRKDPKIIAKYTNEGGSYNIPSLFNKK